ncbi:MAG TPA: DUF6794 domain-containing protein [Pyrinomonadaceae bacterium]|jgi:hypothetical protein
MRAALLTLCVTLACAAPAAGQATGFSVHVVKTYSENGRFYLRTVPFDGEFPTTRGRTFVYETGKPEPLYVFERGFDSVEKGDNNLVLGDDGEVIFYVIPWGADEGKDGLKSVNVYRRGRVVGGYTEAEVNGCDKKRERCTLVYNNDEQVVDRGRSNWGTPRYQKAFKDGVSEREKFLSDFAVFSSGGFVYLTDSKRRTHTFDLKDGRLVGSEAFDDVYERIKGKARFNRTELETYDAPTFIDLPLLKSGADSEAALAAHLGMRLVDDAETLAHRYRWYSLKLSLDLGRDGRMEIEALEAASGLQKEKVVEFFESHRFDASDIPAAFEKWHVGEKYVFLRKADPRVARAERLEEVKRERLEYERRLTAESIDGVYVPKNLGECFVELDKKLTEVDKKEMRAQPGREAMILYHFGLGMWMRNNWGLWGGSRLQKYFTDRGVKDPEEMSSVILYHYHPLPLSRLAERPDGGLAGVGEEPPAGAELIAGPPAVSRTRARKV